jgi:cation:H+ antiporter
MFASFPLVLLIPVFLAGAAAVWLAGIQLSNTTEVIDARFGLGEALGGLVLLDGFGLRLEAALTYEAASLQLVLEGVLVISVLVVAIMGTQLPGSIIFAHLAPGDLLIAALWLVGLWMINRARKDLPWQEKGRAPNTSPPTQSRRQEKTERWSTARVLLIFALAAATALPEVSTGLASVNIGDYQLAFSDIFGGNAFLPVLFLPATLLLVSSGCSPSWEENKS